MATKSNRSKPKDYDYRDTFKVLKETDRLLRRLDEPGRQLKRAETIDRKIADWTTTQKANPPGTFWHRVATYRIDSLQKTNPYERTAGDALGDAWFELWLDLRTLLWGLGYSVLTVVLYVVWFTFLWFVAGPILWDWFWQLPPGLK